MVDLLKDSLGALRDHRGELFHLLSLMVPAAFVIDWSAHALLAPMVGGQGGVLLVMLANIASFLLTIMFMVACHRRFLLGAAAERLPSLGRREARFLGVTLIMAAVAALPSLLLGLMIAGGSPGVMTALAVVLVIILGMLFNLRWGLALPAVALDRTERITRLMEESWTLTRGRFWAMFGAWTVLMIGFVVPLLLFGNLLFVMFGLSDSNALTILIGELIGFTGAAVVAAVLSTAYRAYGGPAP